MHFIGNGVNFALKSVFWWALSGYRGVGGDLRSFCLTEEMLLESDEATRSRRVTVAATER